MWEREGGVLAVCQGMRRKPSVVSAYRGSRGQLPRLGIDLGAYPDPPPPPLPNSRTDGRSEAGDRAIESSRRVFFRLFKGHMSCQGQVKGQNRYTIDTRLITAANPNPAKRLPKG